MYTVTDAFGLFIILVLTYNVVKIFRPNYMRGTEAKVELED
jgi:hypothetical protein